MVFILFFAALALLAAFTEAQTISIGAPLAYSTIAAGSNITVQVVRPSTLTGSQEVAVVIALNSCTEHPDNSCSSFDVTQDLGHVMYTGPFAPTYQTASPQSQPAQNFTILVPSAMPQGEMALTVSHFSLVGAGPYPSLEVKNITLIVQ
ncbi:hypothetical protein CERSUDRAFT_92525 [Gelatoporia subvermispora B]|uniref:Uncharacterized protein n=1 Tax=Ceriporiopsis subvermispora (strain B) TaxID=914234 RepID=M2QSM7_CERS8|nr:hypothetical protein CERSUDRAFT_92525 [Gelatoporia subvermispora B]